MKRRTHLFLVAIDEDPIPGAFDATHIESDVKAVIERSFISGYNPKVVHLEAVVRDSNFLQEVELELSMSLAQVAEDENGERDIIHLIFSAPFTIKYEASNNEMLGEL